MGRIQTDALVLRSFEYSETSLIVWFFTRTNGRLHAIAKGARRPTSEFEGALEPFMRLDIGVFRKAGRDLDILAEVELRDRYPGLRRSVDRMVHASYIVELLSETVQLDAPDPELFETSCETLAELSSGALDRLAVVTLRFEVRLLHLAGFLPNLQGCTVCGGDVDAPQMIFHHRTGGVVCAEHGSGGVGVHLGTIQVLRRLVESERPERIVIVGAQLRELRRLLLDWWRFNLEKDLKTARPLWQHLGP